MKILLITDAYPPMKTSTAVLFDDLCQEFCKQNYDLTVVLPDSEIKKSWVYGVEGGIKVLRLSTPTTKDIGLVRRAINEFLLSFFMYLNFRKSELWGQHWDYIIWHSPTIFFGPLVKILKRNTKARTYLIIRDIFPEWALNLGVLKKGVIYSFFKFFEKYQYSVADVIGVQTHANLAYFKKCGYVSKQKVVVLHNWISTNLIFESAYKPDLSKLHNRFIFVYAGNMGVAQNLSLVIDAAKNLRDNNEIGFLFVGRGGEREALERKAINSNLNNVIFLNEINPSQIPQLYRYCHAGIVMLDVRHKTHNIPGKFMGYMINGLPIVARINPGNDLIDIIKGNKLGTYITDNSVRNFVNKILEIHQLAKIDNELRDRCIVFAGENFSTTIAVNKIMNELIHYT